MGTGELGAVVPLESAAVPVLDGVVLEVAPALVAGAVELEVPLPDGAPVSVALAEGALAAEPDPSVALPDGELLVLVPGALVVVPAGVLPAAPDAAVPAAVPLAAGGLDGLAAAAGVLVVAAPLPRPGDPPVTPEPEDGAAGGGGAVGS